MVKSEMHKKLWGTEEWLANTEKYCGKILTLNPGFRCSYHYHKNKDETFYVLEGKVYLNLDGRDIIMNRGDSQRVLPGQKHTFASLEGISKIIEISTHHEEADSYREIESSSIDLQELKQRLQIE
jgi:quercetin dioxygenase-like cupin family protein